MAEESVKRLPPKTFRTSEIKEEDIKTLPGMSDEQRTKIWERVKAKQESMQKESK